MLIIKDLTFGYSKEPVFKDLNIILQPNLIHGLVGLNGSGKTTLLNTIYGFMKPWKGSLTWDNLPLKRKSFAFLETNNYFYSNITGKEYLSLFPSQNVDFKIDIWQELFQLPFNEMISNYSTGMKKKLALLAILKLEKQILMLDEPFNGLDMETNHILRSIILRLKEKGKTLIITSHILETLTNTCDIIHYLTDKQIARSFQKAEFREFENHIFDTIHDRTKDLIDKVI